MISFGLIADVQYCDAPPYKQRYFRNSTTKLNEAIEEFNGHQLEFVVNLGDLIEQDWNSFSTILPLFNHLHVPVYHVLGNHDYEVNESYKADVPKKIGCKNYYDFSIHPWRFIVLDGNELSTYANPEDSDGYVKGKLLLEKLARGGKVNANFWNGGIGEKQMQWLNRTLIDASVKKQKVIFFCHFPVYPPCRHNLLNDDEVLNILAKYDCVKAWFNGHNHRGNYGLRYNTHFINVKGMVETEHDSAFSLVHLSKEYIQILGFRAEISAQLSI